MAIRKPLVLISGELNELPTGDTISSGASFTGLTLDEEAAPATPATGKVVVYAKTDGLVYSKDDAGTETPLGAGSVGRGIAQIVTYGTGEVASGTATIPYDDTIPQNTEGTQFMSLAITPQSEASLLEIDVTIAVAHSVAAWITAGLFQDAYADAIAIASSYMSPSKIVMHTFKYMTTARTTSATTFKVRAGGGVGGTTTFNGVTGARRYGGVMASRITIKEYLP